MIKEIEYKDIKKDYILIDVRSPLENKDGTISGSYNIPILDNNERKVVGTAYVVLSKNEARRIGVELVSKKLPEIFDKVLELKLKNPKLVVFCARGGYRSTAFASLFCSIGINVFKLKDGYKGYRQYVRNAIPEISNKKTFITIHGNTGVGKTNILYDLKKLGFDILDLEGCANHRGSLLGSVCIGDINTQKSFEANVFEQLIECKSDYIFVEAESKTIGKCVVPQSVFKGMNDGIHINVEASISYRVNSLKKDYVLHRGWKYESIQALEKLRRYISNQKVDELQDMIKQDNFDDVAAFLMMEYYDPMYLHKANIFEYRGNFVADISACDTANKIADWYRNNNFGG